MDSIFDTDSNLRSRGISKVEEARMKVAYGLLKEHVNAAKEGLPPPDPRTNPMIDPRSVSLVPLRIARLISDEKS